MNLEVVLDRLAEAGVSVWLDTEGKLRIDKDAPAELKDLVREHKQELIDVRCAHGLMNALGVRIIRLPLGYLALAYPPRASLDRIRWAASVLKMDSLPLVIHDEGLRWTSYEAWRHRQPLWTKAERDEYRRERALEDQAKLTRRRRTA
jgi:hypothetical protein